MGKKQTQVTPVDPYEVASADATYNRIDQYTPTGNLTFSDRPGDPAGANNVANLTLPPEIQALFDSQTQSDQQLLDLALGRQQGFEEGLPDLVSGLENTDRFNRGNYEDAFFDRGKELLNRQFDPAEENLRQSLANRGQTGTGAFGEAAQTELGTFNDARNASFEQLAREAILSGGAEGRADLQTDIGRQLTGANITQSNRATQFNELASLLGLQGVAQPGLGNFFTPGNADVGGAFALNQADRNANANRNQETMSGILDGIFGIGSAIAGKPS